MRIEKVLMVVAAVLLATLFLQVGLRSSQSEANTSASWRYYPKSVEEARKLSSHIIVGKVASVRSGKLQPRDQEKYPEDVSLPAEVVTFKVQNVYMGNKVETVELFHTGSNVGESSYNRPRPTENPPPKPKKGAVPESQRPARPSEEQTRTILLMDDPGYREGESYLLFLMDGPEVNVDGSEIKTMAVISPEGRYRVVNDRLEPVSHRAGLPEKFRGQYVKELVSALRQ